MKWWPYKKKVKEEVEVKEEKQPKTITIYADDDGLRRAEILMRYAGVCINQTALSLMPLYAEVLNEYKKLDYAAGVNARKKKKPKNTYCPGCKRYLDEIKKDGCGSQRCPPLTAGPTPED